ncbi:hypothetical protein GCM10027067_23680 [Pseudactinotalea suaedae]
MLAVAAIGSLLLTACTATQLPPPQAAGPGAIPLAAFDSCDDLLAHLKGEAAEQVTAWGLGPSGPIMFAAEDQAVTDGAESNAGGGDSAVSSTNNQVEGVDEADVVKTNGEVVVTSVSGKIRVVDASTAEVVATIAVPGMSEGFAELLLDGDDLVVLAAEWGGWAADGAAPVERTTIHRVDLSDPANPRAVGSTRVEGSYRSARMIDGTVRLVLVSQPPGLAFTHPADGSLSAESDALEANRQIVADSTIDDWLPHRQPMDASGNGGEPELLLDCTAIGRPGDFSGFSTVSVITLDDDGDATPTSAAGVLAEAGTVYASTDRLIVATTPWWMLWAQDTDDGPHTDLHAFDISEPGATTYVASGRVEGWLLNQFSLDSADGITRVATTRNPPSAAEPSSSSLVVLTEDGDELVEAGRVDGLGETEQIYAVRYLGPDLAAVVTFRQTDPLYLIDTSDPSSPRVTGELKIPGYSAYLHPWGEDRLLGVGQDATDEGQTTGLQASLFDIADTAAPERVGLLTWEHTSSTVEWDHRAFLLWEDRVYLPAETYDWESDTDGTGKLQIGIVTVDLADGTLTEGPRIDTAGASDAWAGSVIRVLVTGDTLWAVGQNDLYRFDLATLEGGHVTRI